jgi:hypothetical protein
MSKLQDAAKLQSRAQFWSTRHKLREELIGSYSPVIHTARPLYTIGRLFALSAVGFIANTQEDKGV